MFLHENFLKKAMEECMITQLVHDLGMLYLAIVMTNPKNTDKEVQVAMEVCEILKRASGEIAALDEKPKIPHPLDQAKPS